MKYIFEITFLWCSNVLMQRLLSVWSAFAYHFLLNDFLMKHLYSFHVPKKVTVCVWNADPLTSSFQIITAEMPQLLSIQIKAGSILQVCNWTAIQKLIIFKANQTES